MSESVKTQLITLLFSVSAIVLANNSHSHATYLIIFTTLINRIIGVHYINSIRTVRKGDTRISPGHRVLASRTHTNTNENAQQKYTFYITIANEQIHAHTYKNTISFCRKNLRSLCFFLQWPCVLEMAFALLTTNIGVKEITHTPSHKTWHSSYWYD